jgi:two-component system OmpR family sensor kinase
MRTELRLLHIEDDINDFELIQYRLESDGFACTVARVDSEKNLEILLSSDRFDIVFSDFSLPGYDGISAFKLVRQKYPDMPFIFISGSSDEVSDVGRFMDDITGYVLKSNSENIGAAVRRLLLAADRKHQ